MLCKYFVDVYDDVVNDYKTISIFFSYVSAFKFYKSLKDNFKSLNFRLCYVVYD